MKAIISFLIRHIPRKYLQRISHVGLRGMAVFYSGNKVECPVCNNEFRSFLPYGRKARENALCPKCLALERHRLMWLFLQQNTDFFTADLDILHIAPELCFIDRFRAIHGDKYITADLDSPLADVKLDVHSIPFDTNSFDVVFCNHVLEHVADDKQAMQEILKVLKPGGWAILQVPLFYPLLEKTYEDESLISPSDREKAFGQSDHVRMYGQDYSDRLRSVGFIVEEHWLAKEMPREQAERYALPFDEPIFYCQKKDN
jgi:SAM-dependent methyltransferase